MTARICPKCGCVYENGRSECTDCGEFTRKATGEEIADFKKNRLKSMRTVSGTRPKNWQYAASAALAVYSVLIIVLFSAAGFGFPWITIINFLYAVGLLIPVFDFITWIYNIIVRGNNVFQLTYHYTRLKLGLIFVISLNLLSLVIWLFKTDGLLIKLFSL